jgi:arylsulfatase A-like enzyme
MKSDQKQKTTTRVSFLQLFRLFFVLFSLYLLREVFNRWDGFSFYAPFSEYIPAVALVSILWTITAVLTSILAWILFRLIENLSDQTALKIRTEHILLFGAVSVLYGTVVWKIKRLIWTDVQTSEQLKLIVLICVILVSTYTAWILRNKAKHYFDIVQEHISPLVWLFGIFVMVSVPLVSFEAWVKEAERPIPEKFTKSISDKKRPNIILITFDTLTARDMSLYGYQRETTPFISKWAKSATVFATVEASNNHTSPTTASLMTGKRVWTHQLFQQAGSPVKGDTESLPGVLKKNGYFNVAFVVNPWASPQKLKVLNSFDISPLATEFFRSTGIITLDGYQPGVIDILFYKALGDKIRMHDWITEGKLLGRLQQFISPRHILMNPEYTKTAVPPEIVFNKFLKIYDDLPEPFFAWIHVYPPHTYYLPPKPYRGMFGPYLPPERYKTFVFDTSLNDSDDSQNMHDLRMLYDEFIKYCDSQFEEFIVQLEKRNKMKDPIVVLSADHGESFQHNYYGHRGPYLYEQLTHLPLVIKEPNQSDGKVIQGVVEQIDIPATILDFAHIPAPLWMEGRSLMPLMRGEELSSRPVFSMYFEQNPSRGHQITKGLVAVWEGDYKLIHSLENGSSLLFNLKNDPEELKNVIDSNPETGEHLLDLIKTNLNKANERIRSDNPAR